MAAVRFVFSISLAFWIVSVAAAQVPASAAANREERYRIGYQDILDITVFRHAELNTRVGINPDGTIILPRATKPIEAYCKTERELKAIIEADYRSFLKNPYVNVVVAEQKSQSFGVMGAVEKPGNYFVNRRIPLLELLSFAGGPNREAGSRLLVARLGSQAACRQPGDAVATGDALTLMNFRLSDIQEGKRSLMMQPGDIVSVFPQDTIFVYGNVKKQGEVKVKEPRTLRQIIASAEGFAPSSKKDRIRVFRQKPDGGDWEEFVYDFGAIEKGKIADPFLQPSDIVAVSEDKFSAIVRKVTDSVTSGFGNLPIILR